MEGRGHQGGLGGFDLTSGNGVAIRCEGKLWVQPVWGKIGSSRLACRVGHAQGALSGMLERQLDMQPGVRSRAGLAVQPGSHWCVNVP